MKITFVNLAFPEYFDPISSQREGTAVLVYFCAYRMVSLLPSFLLIFISVFESDPQNLPAPAPTVRSRIQTILSRYPESLKTARLSLPLSPRTNISTRSATLLRQKDRNASRKVMEDCHGEEQDKILFALYFAPLRDSLHLHIALHNPKLTLLASYGVQST